MVVVAPLVLLLLLLQVVLPLWSVETTVTAWMTPITTTTFTTTRMTRTRRRRRSFSSSLTLSPRHGLFLLHATTTTTISNDKMNNNNDDDDANNNKNNKDILNLHPSNRKSSSISSSSSSSSSSTASRRIVLMTAAAAAASCTMAICWWMPPQPVMAAESTSTTSSSSDFANLAARANQITKELDQQGLTQAAIVRQSEQTAYDFTLPYEQKDISFGDLIQQEFRNNNQNKDGTTTTVGDDVRVKAIVVVNIKQDDPVARKMIPELIALAAQYKNTNPTKDSTTTTSSSATASSSLAVICCPSDQGYYEPDTSALIRLKLASEYGFGLNPATICTDKVNFLGTGAHPFWRWLQGTCRIPTNGIGRIQGNYEKFLLDGRTGLPLRRYPKRFAPINMADDIQAVITGTAMIRGGLPPPKANYLEEWRAAVLEAERDTYRFEKRLNVFDQ